MVGVNPKDEFQVKCAQLGQQKHKNHDANCDPAFEGREGIPCKFNPSMRTVIKKTNQIRIYDTSAIYMFIF